MAQPDKCDWDEANIEFLGHVVGGEGVSVPTARAKAIAN